MVEIVEQQTIARPSDEVWAALAAFDDISNWAPNVDHSCLTTEQADGVGAIRRVQVGRNAMLEEIVEWQPGRELAYSITGLPPVVRSVTNKWCIDSSGANSRVSLTSIIDAGPRPPQQLVGRILGRVLAKASRDMLGGLQRSLERDPA
ncbi:MAG: SRPBCC family protein [Actinomycetota bacterium]